MFFILTDGKDYLMIFQKIYMKCMNQVNDNGVMMAPWIFGK